MADRLRFHPRVVDDLRAAIGWYEGISVELGKRFRSLVDARFDDLLERPESFPTAFDDVRLARVRRFPYLLLFHESGNAIHVLGVFHAASDPAKWRQRVTVE